MSQVAVLGLGAMGAAIAAKLRGRGTTSRLEPDARPRRRARGRRRAAGRNAGRRGSGRRDRHHDAHRPLALEQVLFGDEGAASAIGRDATLIEMSTVGPSAIASVVERLAPADVIDAPVLGSVPSVETGSLVILAGGEREVFDRHAGLLGGSGTRSTSARPARGVAEARRQRRVDRHAGRARRAAGGHRSRGPRAGDGAREPRGRSARLADRPVASASARSGHVVELPARARAQDLEIAFDEARRLDRRLTVDETAAARSDEAIAAGLGDEDFGAVVGFLRR